MAETFLSCDTMKVHPLKESRKEPQSMIVLSTATLATDSQQFRRVKPSVPKMCCLLPVNAAALFGIVSTSLLAAALYICCVIHLKSSTSSLEGLGGTKMIALLSVALTIIVLFAVLFVWGVLAVRQRLLLPFTTLSCFLLFAVVGTLIATMVTSADEFNTAISKTDGNSGATVADLVIFRISKMDIKGLCEEVLHERRLSDKTNSAHMA
ncbi:unnamed protein product [Haemonchus placei]|uniref:MARVEL domain-containing protein n=1 Tax=Haemonchus placei TaxID=6290 RepID=A0A0N4WC55_HAEPC|nr:unnamed protein product [Haemonchus placei]